MKIDARSAFFIIQLLVMATCLKSQNQPLYFETYNSYHGLTQNSCYDIAQDGGGFMWFATQDGLNRFDGNEFKVYLPGNQIGESLPANHVTCLKFDKIEEVLWIGTVGGVSLYSQKTDSLVPVSQLFPFASALERIPVKKIYQFTAGEIWIITQLHGLVHIDLHKKDVRFYFDIEGLYEHVNGMTFHNDQIVVSVQDKLYTYSSDASLDTFLHVNLAYDFVEIRGLHSFQGKLWIGTSYRGCFYVEDFGHESRVYAFDKVPKAGVGTFMTDHSGKLWIGTRGNGLFVYNPVTDQVAEAQYNKFDERSLGKDFVLSFYADRQGIVWCGLSGGGVSKHDPLRYQFSNLHNNPYDPFSLPGNMVFKIFKSDPSRYYIGTQNKGFIRWDFETDEFHQYAYFENSGVPHNTIYDIESNGDGTLWIASMGGLLHFDELSGNFTSYDQSDHPASQNLYVVHRLRHRDSLLVASEHGMMYFSLKTFEWFPCFSDVFEKKGIIGRYIWETDDGMIWLATELGGLVQLDYLNHRVRIEEDLLPISANCRYIYDDDGVFWLATDNGVVVYDSHGERIIKHLPVNHYYQSNVCYSIQKDQSGHFWVGTNFGLVKIDQQTFDMQYYNLHNGLDFLEYNTACVSSGKNLIVFGGVGGLTKFNPMDLQTDIFSPDPLITSVRVNDRIVPPQNSSPATFDHSDNHIAFSFTANNFSNQERNHYYYRMRGLSEEWVDNRFLHSTVFNSLAPGEYVFQVKSANSHGVMSDNVAEFSFQIHPPWWKSWWFFVLLLGSLLITSVLMIKRRLSAVQNKAELERRVVETEIMALRAQMNPHFIFNCINSIDAFIQSNNKYQATTYLNKFARLLRNVLDSSRQSTVTFSKDFETLKLYLDLEQLRHSNKFITELYADKLLLSDDFKVPPLLIQPYVENAILHGLKYRSDNNGRLKISARLAKEKIHYIIEDNGVGRSKTKNGITRGRISYGMKMTYDRIRFFNDEDEASVVVTDLTEGDHPTGTRIEVFLDIK